jgi:pimeloyl-ACP methyl ester carboxylesterase
MWNSVANRDGHRIGYRLINYILDRRRHAERWTTALEQTDVPLRFVWGMLDPVSGGHVAPRIRERLPHAHLVCLDRVGHWPSLEDPDAVVSSIRQMIGRA